MCRTLSCFPYSLFTVFLCLYLLISANLVAQVENKSFFGIGTRIIGDQLLLKDLLQTPPIGLTEEPAIKFKYAIVEPITYLEIESDKNVLAKVSFSYELSLVDGTISSINSQEERGKSKPEPFEVVIQIYGFNETMLNVNPAYILNRDQQFNGVLKPIYQQHINQSLSLMEEEEDSKALDELSYDDDDDDDDDAIDDDDTIDEEDIDYEEDFFNNNYDKIIEQGQRQEGDFLVYESNQTSAAATEEPTNHSVTFYYVDIYYITYVKFVIYEHYLYHPLNNYNNTYVVEYANISPTTLKAIVTDHRTTSLFVQMQMYGFHPTALPVDYKPFLSNSQTSAATRPISSLTQLKILMNAQQQQQEHQGEDNTRTDGELQRQPIELDYQISSDNRNKLNCTGSDSQRIFSHWSIFNLIVITIFGRMMIFTSM